MERQEAIKFEQTGPPEKKKRKLGTIENLKTAVTAHVRSKPSAEGQEYLDLWSLKRDRARWVRAKAQAEERIKTIDKMIEKIDLLDEEQDQSDSGNEPKVQPIIRTIDLLRHPRRKRRTRKEQLS